MKCYKPGSGDFTASPCSSPQRLQCDRDDDDAYHVFSSPQSLQRDHHDQQGCDDDEQDA